MIVRVVGAGCQRAVGLVAGVRREPRASRVRKVSLKKLLGHDPLEARETHWNLSPEDALREFWEQVLR